MRTDFVSDAWLVEPDRSALCLTAACMDQRSLIASAATRER
jgi:hypothetical protein